MSVPSLSALTPAVVDDLFGIATALPDEHPTFIWLVGSPGAGKSSGHARAMLPLPYATINLDTLLESLAPFRVASALGHYLEKTQPESGVTFSSISAYKSRNENLGLFKTYNAHAELLDPAARAQLQPIRDTYSPLLGSKVSADSKLTEIASAAIKRAIDRSVNIIYETTISLNKSGKVKKVQEIMKYLAAHGPQYRVAFYHVYGSVPDVASRIEHRQEYGMPYEEKPYYRFVAVSPAIVEKYIEKNAEAFAALRHMYRKKPEIVFDEWENELNLSRLPQVREFNAEAQLERIVGAYGPMVLRRKRTSSERRKRESSERRKRESSERRKRESSERRKRELLIHQESSP